MATYVDASLVNDITANLPSLKVRWRARATCVSVKCEWWIYYAIKDCEGDSCEETDVDASGIVPFFRLYI